MANPPLAPFRPPLISDILPEIHVPDSSHFAVRKEGV